MIGSSVRELLYREHAPHVYDGIGSGTLKLDGWTDHRGSFERLVPRDAKVLLEVGCWMGKSTAMLAELAPQAEIVALDTWLGSEEFYTDRNLSRDLRFKNGRPDVYGQFLSNMVSLGISDRVTPFSIASSAGLEVLRKLGVSPDVCYIDASHSYDDVLADIAGCMELKPRMICGDDYNDYWPGVVNAVDEFFGDVTVEGTGFWYVQI